MRLRLWQAIDDAAHILYQPTALGDRAAALRWHHRVHLIPGRALAWVCDRYDVALGVDES